MRRLWILLGFVVGVVFVWALLHEDRRIADEQRKANRALRPLAERAKLELAMQGAVDGVDYLSDDYWQEELAQYSDVDALLNEMENDDEIT